MKSGKIFWIVAAALVVVGVAVRWQNSSTTSNAASSDTAMPERSGSEGNDSALGGMARASSPSSTSPAADEVELGSHLAKLMSGQGDFEALKLRDHELHAFLRVNRTNAASLLTAFESTHDREFLKVAAASHPSDPMVQAKILTFDVFPEDRAKWVAAFKASAPDNAFPNLVAARDAIKQGDLEAVFQEIEASRGKSFNDYTREAMVGMEEAYLGAGRSVAESKALGSSDVMLPQLAQFKELANQLKTQALEVGPATAEGERLLKSAWDVGTLVRNYGQSGIILNDLVGLAIQNIALGSWPANKPAEFLDRTVAEAQAENLSYRKSVREGTEFFNKWLTTAPEHEIISYVDRLKTFGEPNARDWVRSRSSEGR